MCNINSIGPILAKSINEFFKNDKNNIIIDNLLKEIKIKNNEANTQNKLEGLTFVITGNLNQYENIDALVKVIENMGGKTVNSVSSKTSYLINNDINSNSTKNKTAQKLNIKIITEEQFKEMIK